MIDRKKNPTRYLVRRQSQHTIYYSTMEPKSFTAVMVRKTTAQSERHTKSNASVTGASGEFFHVADRKTHRNANTSTGSKTDFKSLSQLPNVNSYRSILVQSML